jgi:hypothetical protein
MAIFDVIADLVIGRRAAEYFAPNLPPSSAPGINWEEVSRFLGGRVLAFATPKFHTSRKGAYMFHWP